MVTCVSRLHYPASEPETPTKQDDTIRFSCNGILLKSEVLLKFFAEDFKKVKQLKTPIDPRGPFVNCWSKIFLAACLVSMFVDPLFLYMPMVQPVDQLCLEKSASLGRILTSIRSTADMFFATNILVRFRTAYVAPSSCVFGAGDLVVDPWKIALRYITTKGFWFDIVAALPIPQVLIMGIIPHLGASGISDVRISLVFLMMIQYLQRLIIASPLTMEIAKATGVIIQASWIGAAYNLTLYLLLLHMLPKLSQRESLEHIDSRGNVLSQPIKPLKQATPSIRASAYNFPVSGFIQGYQVEYLS